MTVPPIYAVFRLWRGATFSEPLQVKNPDNTPVDLTGWTARCVISIEDAPIGATPLYELTTENGGISIDGPNGGVTLSIAAEDTDPPASPDVDGDPQLWAFKLVLTNPTPNPDYVERLAQGVIVANP